MRACVRNCVLLLLVACGMSACVDEAATPAPVMPGAATLAAPGAAAAPGTAPPAANADPVAARYQAHRRAFQLLADDGDPNFAPRLETAEDAALFGAADTASCMDAQACAFDLMTCDDGSDYIGGFDDSGRAIDPLASRTASAAYYAVWLERTLSGLRYPRDLWQPVVSRMESEFLRLLRAPPVDPALDADLFAANEGIEDAARAELVPLLNAHRAEVDPSLPVAYVEGGCGAGEIGITVATAPADGVVRFIPVFFHRLCSVQGIDPDDPVACDHWREPADGVLFDVAGDYRYRAQWPDGSRRNGTLAFTNLEDGQTVTIRKP